MMMDIDLDLDSDRIKDFLQSKLNEIKSTNAQLENSLQHRGNILSALQREIDEGFSCSNVRIEGITKKLFHNKYVFLIGLRNESKMHLDNVNVILDWNCPSPLGYEFFLTSPKSSSLLRCADHIEEAARIVVVLDVPFFAHQLDCTITGSVIFRLDGKKISLRLPSVIQLTPQDIADNSVVVQVHRMIDGGIEDFLACAFANEKHEFVMVIPANWTRLLETTLEIDCSLYRVNLTSNKKYFLVEKVSPFLDGALLEVEDEEFGQRQSVHFSIYCRNQEVLVGLIHYLYRHIAGVIIIPKSLYSPELGTHDTVELIKDSVLAELNRLEAISDEDLVKFRIDMADLEHRTDILVSRIKQNTK